MKSALVACLLLAAPVVAGCGTDAGASDGRPTVVASFYPLGYVAGRIAGEHAEVETLAAVGAEPHDLELTVQQTGAIADSDLLVHLHGFQPAVDDAADLAPESIDAADVAELDPEDPHFWLDPHKMGEVADAVRDGLVEIDPEHAEAYRANHAELSSDLDRLDDQFASGLETCARRTVVVSHDAFGYLATRYRLDFHAINGLSPAAEPSPAHLGELADLIEAKGITTVFSETLASPELASTLADDLGLRTDVLDPVEGLTEATADEDYVSLMRTNLEALRKANDCS
jgi:zinc transport system substrate-binding protein